MRVPEQFEFRHANRLKFRDLGHQHEHKAICGIPRGKRCLMLSSKLSTFPRTRGKSTGLLSPKQKKHSHSREQLSEDTRPMLISLTTGLQSSARCPYRKPHRASTRNYPYCMPVTYRNKPSNGERPATKTKLRIANGQTARSAFSREHLEARFDQPALRV
jgi:hypothetical protein